MSFEEGDRVIATETFGGWGSKIPKGTKGVITDLVSGWFSSSLTVRFENGETERDVDEGRIAKI